MEQLTDFFFIRTHQGNLRIDLGDVHYMEADSNYTNFVCGKKIVPVLTGLKYVENLLSPQLFCRIHRSYIVCIRRIKRFNKKTVELDSGVSIPVAAAYYMELEKRVFFLHKKRKREDKA
jgi:two-component system LytT family response regulator